MFIQNNERPSCDPVDVQLMSENTELQIHDLRKLLITAAFGIYLSGSCFWLHCNTTVSMSAKIQASM